MTDVTRDERAELNAALGRIEALLIEIAGRPPGPRLTIAELAPAEPKPARPLATETSKPRPMANVFTSSPEVNQRNA